MKKSFLCLLLLCCLGIATVAHADISMLAINVGKADSILLENGNIRYLIDIGTAQSWGSISAVLKTRGITHLDGVIATHTHSDHVGGAAALAASDISVDAWYASAFYTCKKNKHPLVQAAAERKQNVIFLSGGDTLPFGDASLVVLGPIREDETENNNSLVLRCDSPYGSILLTGDMEFPQENTLFEHNLLSPVTVLKVANHANPDACSDALIQRTRPEFAVISTDSTVDTNTPSKRILRTLMAVGSRIAVTQNAVTGILVTLSENGADMVLVTDQLPEIPDGITIESKNISTDSVTLANHGAQAVDISNWYIFSTRGKQTFIFPQGTVLQANATLTVKGKNSSVKADFIWDEKTVWHKTKDDTAQLYNAYGQLVDERD